MPMARLLLGMFGKTMIGLSVFGVACLYGAHRIEERKKRGIWRWLGR